MHPTLNGNSEGNHSTAVLPDPISVGLWYAVHTRSRHERMVCTALMSKDFHVFLPERVTWSRRQDRRKQISVPLFPGYLFVSPNGRLENLHEVKCTRGVVRILGVNGLPLPVSLREVESLRLLVASGELCRPVSYLVPGNRVRVLDGPLTGAEGMILRHGGKKRLIVSIELMQRSVAVELPECQLEKIADR